MNKYKLKNLDCTSCADKIEKHLLKLKLVKEVSVNFSASSILIDTEDLNEVRKAIKEVEPQVELIEEDAVPMDHNEDEFNFKGEIFKIIFVIALFIAGMIFRNQFHNTQYDWIEYVFFLAGYLISGWKVLSRAFKNIINGKVFDENFLMSLATLGAIAIHELPEAVAVMLFYQIGEFLQEVAVNRSRRSIKALLEIKPDYANLKTNGNFEKVSPDKVALGALLVVKPGERVPLDGTVLEGASQIDTSALTGESVPKTVKAGDSVLAGMINQSGLLTVRVTKLFKESSISKILDLVENAANKKAPTEKFISKFAGYYTPVVVFIAVAVAFLPPLIFPNESSSDWVYRALVLLVISCPCALVISIPLGYFGGIGAASKRGVLVKGSNFLDILAEVKTVVFDKTGTLTKGTFKVTEIVPKNNFNKDEILQLAAMAEAQSNHPLAKSILEAYAKKVDLSSIKGFQEIAGHGIKVKLNDKSVLVGNDRLMHLEKIPHDTCIVDGTVAHIAVNQTYAGYIVIADELKEDAAQAIKSLKDLGIQNTVMLTGDNEYAAKAIAQQLHLDNFYAGLLPENKVEHIERILKETKGKVAFVGDGINDSPVLARADVGIAMGALGSDAAIETANVVLMTDHPSKVATAIHIAKGTRKVVWQNIGLALVVKGIFIVLGGLGVATMWEAVFADMGVALLAIFNATRLLK